MNYYVTTQGRNNLTLFLADRKITKKHWWTINLFDAMAFVKESAAQYSAKRLHYKNPQVINSNEAERREKQNDYQSSINEIHPFSEEAFGN